MKPWMLGLDVAVMASDRGTEATLTAVGHATDQQITKFEKGPLYSRLVLNAHSRLVLNVLVYLGEEAPLAIEIAIRRKV